MANDPAFLFYPGDYLRDTQCLSEKTQVAYDRIMCEHMRNICISPAQLNFFTKRLSPEEVSELKMVLRNVNGGFQIHWVAESISKRKAYSESRRGNRKGKGNNISKSYVKHMENENENENVDTVEKEVAPKKQKPERNILELVHPFDSPAWFQAWDGWIAYRKEIGKPYKSFRGTQSQLKWFSDNDFTVAESIEIIQESIRNQYQGLFKPKQNGSAQITTPSGYTKRPKGFHTEQELHEAALRVVSGK